jgi:hypothetical protein
VRHFVLLLVSISFLCYLAVADQSNFPNTDSTYRQLRDITIGAEAVSVNNFVLKRDAGTFTFKQGTFSFVAAVNGKVTGAVFSGEGEFRLDPPIASERQSLSILTRSTTPGIAEAFRTLVLRFTDNTYEEIKQGGMAASVAGNSAGALRQSQDDARKKLRQNFDARILQDVLSNDPGGLFLAFINGQTYSGKMLYCVDPHGCDFVAPEEVSLMIYDDTKYGIWAAFHFADEYPAGTAKGTQENTSFDIESQNLDTKIDKAGYVRGNALATIVPQVSDLRVVGFDLFHALRVQSVTDAAGTPLQFIQEDKDRDAGFWVILPKSAHRGEKIRIRTVYEGKDAVVTAGSGNFFPVARDNWYPNTRFGRYANYDLKFSTPKKVQIVATGALVSQAIEGDQNVTVWKSEAPLSVAGFNLGDFKRTEAKEEQNGYLIESYANKEPPDFVREIKGIADADQLTHTHQTTGLTMGTMDTTTMMKKPLAEAQLATWLYSSYFGAVPYKRIAMTQQTACGFGQSWPNLIYLPICSFFDSTVRHQLGLDDNRGYWKTVAPHEVAHQWWGHAVGFNSYRDQWISEGFAEFSASLFVQIIMKNQDEFLKLWRDQLDLMTERNKEGFRAFEVGPLTEGYRLNTAKTGWNITRRVIYPKGAFVLHMLRMMMYDNQTGDANFKAMMRDFVQTYYNKAASTEDFKAMVEKHMLPGMNLAGNGKMDWFFDEYVYGTALPDYNLEQSVSPGENGAFKLKVKITQSNVDDSFRMMVPLYVELADGKIIRLGAAKMQGNKVIEQTIPFAQPPRRAILNYYYDVLGTGY